MIKQIAHTVIKIDIQNAKKRPRCAAKSKSNGFQPHGVDKHRCCRYSLYLISGVPLCAQHAGGILLNIVIDS